MPFDLATAMPARGGFDLSTARPVDDPRLKEIPPLHEPESPPKQSRAAAVSEATNDLVGGGLEAAGTLVTGTAGSVVGGVAGLVRSITSGKFGTQEGVREGDELAAKVRDAMTYQPRGEHGKAAVKRVGDFLEPLQAVNPGMVPPMAPMPPARAVAGSVRDAMGAAGRKVGDIARDVVADDVSGMPKPAAAAPAMAGVGSAETDVAAMRRTRAESLPVPLKLTKGQASRDFEQQRFERETAKDGKAGKPIRERYAEQNEQILRNFDAWVDQTGAEAPDLRATGRAVDAAIVEKAKAAKERVNGAYDRARKAGAMNEMIPTEEIVAFLESNRPAAINAGVLTGAEQKLVQLGGATKGEGDKLSAAAISINDLEELRKFVGSMADKDATNRKFGGDLKRVIDQSTEGRGGELYREARKLRSDYAREFEDHAIVDKLLSTKRGTADRAVAFEDVFKHSILDGSFDDVDALRKTLQSGGAKGEQAWRELQGQTVNHLKDIATKGVTTDVRGNRIVSAAALDRAVRELDRDGKLDLIFGKRDAQQLRDLNDLAKDVYTAPPGTVNSSGTVSVLLQALGEMSVGKLGVGTAKAVAAAKKAFDSRKLRRRVSDALEDPTIRELSDEEKSMRVGDLIEHE